MRSTRNIFIVNMAVSGVLLCSFTMPLTLVDLLYKYWALGTDQVDMAVSWVLLCSFTMPLTLVDLLYKYWALGTDQVDMAVSGVLP
jgi:neuropeptide Y receptor